MRGEKSQVLSTTGTQLLVQEGFEFPWKDDVICPVAKIFGAKELKEIDTDEILLGYVEPGWVYFSVGEVSFWLRAIEGKFPKADQLLTPADTATYLTVHPTDVAFILDKYETLPGKKEHESPVHLILDDGVQVRAFDTPQKSGVTLQLTRSSFTGEPVNFAMNRLFLKNALR